MNLTPELFGLNLLLLPGIGRKTVCKILERCDETPTNPGEVLEALHMHAGKRGEKITAVAVTSAFSQADKIISESLDRQIKTLSIRNPSYPDQLKTIEDPPPVVFIKGKISSLQPLDSIAVIGTRHPTEFAAKSAFRIASRLAKEQFIIISGLALGCDTKAHQGCIDSEGRTVSILAHGLDKVYPKSNTALAEQILDYGGALVSEYHLGEEPRPAYFVERDRIQSGLSRAVFVIETDVDGGTMQTVRFAMKQGRELVVLSHPDRFANDPKSAGNRELLAINQIRPIRDLDDLKAMIDNLRNPIERSSADHKGSHLTGAQTNLLGNER